MEAVLAGQGTKDGENGADWWIKYNGELPDYYITSKNWIELHESIKKAFDFPEYYGRNWSAFWDLLYGIRDNTIVEIKRVATLPDKFESHIKK